MMLVLPFLTLALAVSPAFADIAKCRITGAKKGSIFSRYIGGKVIIYLENGSTSFYHAENSEPISLSVISSDLVSSFSALRSRCIYGTEKVVHQDGILRAMRFKFNSCVHSDAHSPGVTGYVRAEVGFDLASRTGSYREIFLTPRGVPPAAHATFEQCRVELQY